MIQVVNWPKFQHYKGRRPPWIKLYRDLLERREWHALSGDASKLLTECWLIAAEFDGGVIPMDVEALAWRLRREDSRRLGALLQELVRLGFLATDIVLASTPLAPRKQVATPEVETETEKETDKNNSGGQLNVENSVEHTIGSVALEAHEVLGMGTWGGELTARFNETKGFIRRQFVDGGVPLASVSRAIHGLRVMVDNGEIEWLAAKKGKPLDGMGVLVKEAIVEGPDGSRRGKVFQLAQEAYARDGPTRRTSSTGPERLAVNLKHHITQGSSA